MKPEEAIGYTIRRLRRLQGKFSTDIAYDVPMSRSYLCEIERGQKSPSVEMLTDISRALGIRTADLWRAVAEAIDGKL